MKKITVLLGLLFAVAIGTSQIPDMRTKMIYNASQCRYEVYATPNANASSFLMGGSQIVIAVPHNQIINYTQYRRDAFQITTVLPNINPWVITAYADKDLLLSYTGPFDYYAVDNNGGNLGALSSGTDVLLFHFTISNNCISGLRLWEGVGATPNNYNDPKYPIGGGDFQTNISEVSGANSVEKWTGNNLNTPTSITLPPLAINYVCNAPTTGFATITASVSGGASCQPTSYLWSGNGLWFGPAPTGNSGFGIAPYGTYNLQVTYANGCVDNATLVLDPNCGIVFPVELIKFTVSKDDNDAVLNWVTAAEVNNNYFNVEHSTDAENFSQVGKVNSKSSNSTTVQTYNFRHTRTVKGVNYYRLKQVDLDGSFEYSDVRSVVFGGATGLTIYPNPTSDILKVEIPLGMDENSVIEIINAAGQVVRSVTNPKAEGKVFSMNVKDISIGYYFIQIKTADDIYREQFVITK